MINDNDFIALGHIKAVRIALDKLIGLNLAKFSIFQMCASLSVKESQERFSNMLLLSVIFSEQSVLK